MYYAYHKSGKRMLVEHEEYQTLIESKEWFDSPTKAQKAAAKDAKVAKSNADGKSEAQ